MSGCDDALRPFLGVVLEKCVVLKFVYMLDAQLYIILVPLLCESSTCTLASYPGPSRGGRERAWYTLRAHALGSP